METIHLETKTKFNLLKRLHILLGGILVVKTKVLTKAPVDIIGDNAQDHIEGGLINKIKKLWKGFFTTT